MIVERRSTLLPMMATDARASGSAGVKVTGVGVPWLTDSLDIGFIEQFALDAFRMQDKYGFDGVMGLYAHERNFVLGTVDAGTMQVAVARDGLRYTIELPRSAEYIAEIVGRQDVAGASISFVTLADEWSLDGLNIPQRLVTEAFLIEISIVANPAYGAGTSAMVASGPLRALPAVPEAAEQRVGKKISAASAEQIKSAVDALMSLLEDEATEDEPAAGPPLESAATPARAARPLAPDVAARCRELGIQAGPLTWYDAASRLHALTGRWR